MKRKSAPKPATTRITLTLPNDLLADLDAAAAADHRTRTNYLTYMIRHMIARTQVSQGIVLRDVPHAYRPRHCAYTEPDDAC